ncbi:CMP-N-acetylneuraminate-poly-alpha-2,8-sialyltransferase-like [Lytechinus pictus]|uniref:CMP-N-acetylneuraminate-poly-alpha-2, 8-sialyltransferase-like n=1 Tax=Lytechinus pictus TaxID=7653 RepID=UPI0030B9F344
MRFLRINTSEQVKSNESEPNNTPTGRLKRPRKHSDCVTWQENCAIVGNSGILLGSECGDVIDSAQYVIRLNLADVGERFQHDVGSKIDVMTMNHEQMSLLTSCIPSSRGRKPSKNCNDLMKGMNIFKQHNRTLWFFKTCSFIEEIKEVLGLIHVKKGWDFRFAYSPGFPMKAAKRLLGVRIPSSGFAAYVAATQFCREISLYGFYPFNQTGGASILNHYYDKQRRSGAKDP